MIIVRMCAMAELLCDMDIAKAWMYPSEGRQPYEQRFKVLLCTWYTPGAVGDGMSVGVLEYPNNPAEMILYFIESIELA